MNYCIANWKMNKTISESINFLEEFKKKALQNIKSKIMLCPSFTSLKILETHLTGTKIELGSQNVHQKKRGAYTGEISVEMLKEIECEWVILGHSERRQYFLEEDVIINDKMNTVIENDLKPILCIGENESQRNKNETFDVLKNQLSTALSNITLTSKMLIAYEPVWAIGTGLSANFDQINEVVNWISQFLLQEFSLKVPILYGGSVSAVNCESIISLENVSGFLIGTSALDVNEFSRICSIVNER